VSLAIITEYFVGLIAGVTDPNFDSNFFFQGLGVSEATYRHNKKRYNTGY
jgi:hypothetical protein